MNAKVLKRLVDKTVHDTQSREELLRKNDRMKSQIKHMKKLIASSLVIVLCGCAGLYSSIVTVTKVRDNAMKELAQLSKQGKISIATDMKIGQADSAYRAAAEVAVKALEEYKVTGDKTKYVQALSAVKVAVGAILDILTPLISQSEAVTYQTQLLKAQTL